MAIGRVWTLWHQWNMCVISVIFNMFIIVFYIGDILNTMPSALINMFYYCWGSDHWVFMRQENCIFVLIIFWMFASYPSFQVVKKSFWWPTNKKNYFFQKIKITLHILILYNPSPPPKCLMVQPLVLTTDSFATIFNRPG